METERDGEKVHQHEMIIDEIEGETQIKERDITIDKEGHVEITEVDPEIKRDSIED